MNTETTAADLDTATKMVTAFGSFDILRMMVKKAGYVPTLRTDAYPGKSKKNAAHRAAVLTVRAGLRAEGLKSWPEVVEGE